MQKKLDDSSVQWNTTGLRRSVANTNVIEITATLYEHSSYL